MAKVELTRKDLELIGEALMANGMRTRDELRPEDAVRKLEISKCVFDELSRDGEDWVWTLKVTGLKVKGDTHDGTDSHNRNHIQRENDTGEAPTG